MLGDSWPAVPPVSRSRAPDPGPAILAPSSAQGGCQSKATPPQQQHAPCRRSVRCACVAAPLASPAPAAAPPGARAPRRRLRTGLGLPGSAARLRFSALFGGLVGARPPAPCRVARLPAGPLVSPAARPWRGGGGPGPRRAALLALALCAPGARGRALGGSRLW